MSVKIQVLSDLHLEISVNRPFVQELPQTGDILALTGDIGDPFHPNYSELLDTYSKKYKDIFVVLGNHEFYKNEYYSTKFKVGEICNKYDNVHFFDIATKEVVEYKELGIRFFGTTLWSNVIKERRGLIGMSLNDYNYISIGDPKEAHLMRSKAAKRLKVDQTVEFHNEELKWIKSEIEKTKEKKMTCCIFSHHAPVWENVMPESDKFLGDAWANKLEYLMGKENHIQLWAFGHTHLSSNFKLKGTHLYSNQFGYQFNREKTGYKLDDSITVYSNTEFQNMKD